MKDKKQRFDISSLRQFSEKGRDSVRNAIGSFSNYSYSVFGRSNEGHHGGGSRGGAARSLASHAAQDEFEEDIFEEGGEGNEREDEDEGASLPPDLR